MFLLRFIVSLLVASSIVAKNHPLNCDYLCNSAYCGFLTLERGDGPGNYNHATPVLHGLWPQVSPYGDSACLNANKNAPVSQSDISCYGSNVGFAKHEWSAHGYCAAPNPQAFFPMACALANQPLKVMAASKANGGDLDDVADALTNAGYHVMSTAQGTDEVHLLVCATDGTDWTLVTTSPDPSGGSSRRFHMR